MEPRVWRFGARHDDERRNGTRLNEAVMHFGESIKEIINEEFGDGIMSAIDFYCSVDKVQGADGKDRVVVTFDGKYLPYSEQRSDHMMSRLTRKTS